MDLKNVLTQLREQREALDAAISSLERLESGGHRGPGRPPGVATKSPTNGTSSNHTAPSLTQSEG
jgi:hypothetical protein